MNPEYMLDQENDYTTLFKSAVSTRNRSGDFDDDALQWKPDTEEISRGIFERNFESTVEVENRQRE